MASIKAGTTEIRHLRYFLALAEAGHFGRAARVLHVAQPTLSHQIQQLEAQMGATLFDRSDRRRTRLTAAGEALRLHAARIVRELGEGRRAVAAAAVEPPQSGCVRVGLVATIHAGVVPEAVARFRQDRPGMTVSVSELSIEALEAQLEAGDLDLGIGFLPARNPRLEVEALFEERLVVLLAGSHPWATRRSVRVEELADQPLALINQGFCTRELVQEALEERGLRVSPVLESNTVEGVLAAVGRGDCVTLLPEMAVRASVHPDLVVVSLVGTVRTRRVGLLWPPATSGGRPAVALILSQHVRKSVASADQLPVEERSTPSSHPL